LLLLALALLRAVTTLQRAVPYVLGVFFLAVLLGALVTAWASFVLHQQGWAVYETPKEYSLGTFLDYYVYLFLEMIPALKICDTLNFSKLIDSKDVVAGIPVLAFRVFVVIGVLGAFKSWWKTRKAPGGTPA